MEKILLVDDDHFFRQVYSGLLAEAGYAVDTAACSQEALERIKEGYGLVISDLVLPDMNGLDLLARLKRHAPAPEVIIVTGHADVETAISALKNGARDYLVKPINHEEFLHAVALCHEQKRLLEENKELKGLVKLLAMGQTIATCLDLDRLHTLVVELLCREVGVTRALGMFREPGNSAFVLEEISGFTNNDGQVLHQAIQPHISEGIREMRTVERLENFLPAGLDLKKARPDELNQALLLFARSKKGVQGVVILFNDPGRPLRSGISRRNITFILEQASLALDNASRFAKAKDLLYLDDLTGLFNHRYLDISLDREMKRAERYGSELAVIFLDIDTFKSINDCYGHLIGSAVLKEIGAILKKSVREIDTVLRYGGDEFVIILVESPAAESAVVAERIRRAIEARTFQKGEGYDIRITASVGYACYPDDAANRRDLLDKADQAMYRGKNAGKNIVFRAGD